MSKILHRTTLTCAACGRQRVIEGVTVRDYGRAFERAVHEEHWLPRPHSEQTLLWCVDCGTAYGKSRQGPEEFQRESRAKRNKK